MSLKSILYGNVLVFIKIPIQQNKDTLKRDLRQYFSKIYKHQNYVKFYFYLLGEGFSNYYNCIVTLKCFDGFLQLKLSLYRNSPCEMYAYLKFDLQASKSYVNQNNNMFGRCYAMICIDT